MPRVWQTLRRWLARIGLLPDEEGIFYIGGSVVLPPPLSARCAAIGPSVQRS